MTWYFSQPTRDHKAVTALLTRRGCTGVQLSVSTASHCCWYHLTFHCTWDIGVIRREVLWYLNSTSWCYSPEDFFSNRLRLRLPVKPCSCGVSSEVINLTYVPRVTEQMKPHQKSYYHRRINPGLLSQENNQ